MIRTLRMMVAVGCLAVSVACSILWYRSYASSDGTWAGHPYASIHSAEGRIFIRFTGNPFTDPPRFRELIQRFKAEPLVQPSAEDPYLYLREAEEPWWEQESVLGFAWLEEPPGATWINFPQWAPILVCALHGFAFAYKLPFRFDLRSILIVTTLLALLLGVGVYLYRR